MNQIIDNLWVGDLRAALDTETLKANNISSVLTATFNRFQINLDDTEDADILAHLFSAAAFIEAEHSKGKGVLVHCQAGISRSATIVAAYLMYVRHIDVGSALELIRKARPSVQPNPGFLRQLEIFHQASYKVSKRDKATRMFYLERVVQNVMNGDGEVETDFFAKFPQTPSDSVPPTPTGPRRKIRCKMCRQELATREHMLDHGQLGPPTPASAAAFSPAASRRPSMHDGKPYNLAMSPSTSRRPSMHDSRPLGLTPLAQATPTMSRRPSGTAHEPTTRSRLGSNTDTRPLRSSLLALESAAQLGQNMSDSLSESALEEEESDEDPGNGGQEQSAEDKDEQTQQDEAEDTDRAPQQEARPSPPPLSSSASGPLPAISPILARRLSQSSGLMHGSDLAAQLYANPKLAALRSPPAALNMTALTLPVSSSSPSGVKGLPYSPPILVNPKCSGYFVEPMKWMDVFLEDGQMAGKIVCPNKKCGAKLGNFDWAGVCCGCKEWVVPGFCIHRSKVDEVV
ncbi:hypothetical protein IEO21_03688 [Rhodonia placenta]|uniref:protein-tyrosine-phosphatase n=1 Tax=Rhodonia placenta TaxID=104341 RepID=A0A8H7P5A5_9APHY|nr:hypothetical protein IEO21_03688 [Postia placenta]